MLILLGIVVLEASWNRNIEESRLLFLARWLLARLHWINKWCADLVAQSADGILPRIQAWPLVRPVTRQSQIVLSDVITDFVTVIVLIGSGAFSFNLTRILCCLEAFAILSIILHEPNRRQT